MEESKTQQTANSNDNVASIYTTASDYARRMIFLAEIVNSVPSKPG